MTDDPKEGFLAMVLMVGGCLWESKGMGTVLVK